MNINLNRNLEMKEFEASVGVLRSILPFTQNTHTYDVETAVFMYKKFMN